MSGLQVKCYVMLGAEAKYRIFCQIDTDLFSLRMQKEKSTAKNEQILLTKNLEEIKKTHLQAFLGIIKKKRYLD